MNIGIFSGTFDPVHDGHIQLAREARDQAGLDEVLFTVEAAPRRKRPLAAYEHRTVMVERAIKGLPGLGVFKAKERQHTTMKTLQIVQAAYPQARIWLIMGGDVFEYIEKWEDYQRLVKTCGFIVGLRTEDDGEIAVAVRDRTGADVQIIASSLPRVSSSRIRRSVGEGILPVGLPEPVLGYIYKHRLYGHG